MSSLSFVTRQVLKERLGHQSIHKYLSLIICLAHRLSWVPKPGPILIRVQRILYLETDGNRWRIPQQNIKQSLGEEESKGSEGSGIYKAYRNNQVSVTHQKQQRSGSMLGSDLVSLNIYGKVAWSTYSESKDYSWLFCLRVGLFCSYWIPCPQLTWCSLPGFIVTLYAIFDWLISIEASSYLRRGRVWGWLDLWKRGYGEGETGNMEIGKDVIHVVIINSKKRRRRRPRRRKLQDVACLWNLFP